MPGEKLTAEERALGLPPRGTLRQQPTRQGVELSTENIRQWRKLYEAGVLLFKALRPTMWGPQTL